MWSRSREVYRGAWDFARSLPLIVAIPVAAELVQHIVEYQVGLFDGFAQAEEAGEHPARIWTGGVKILALALMGLWVPRFLAFGGDRERTIRVSAAVLRRYSLVILIALALWAGQTLAGPMMDAAGLAEAQRLTLGTVLFIAAIALEIFLICWMAAAAIGDERITIPVSVRLTAGNFWWSFLFLLWMFAPLMIVHYGLNVLAIGRPTLLMWALLVSDSLLVGYMGAVFAGIRYIIYRRCLERGGLLLPA